MRRTPLLLLALAACAACAAAARVASASSFDAPPSPKPKPRPPPPKPKPRFPPPKPKPRPPPPKPKPRPPKRPTAVRVLHINDPHARIEPADSNFVEALPPYDSAYGGLPRLARYVAKQRAAAAAAGEDMLVLHAGDQYQGTAWHLVYTHAGNHTPMWQMLNPIGFDAMTVGNHEFDNGPANLADFAAGLAAPLISCNINASRHAALGAVLKRFVVKTLPVSGKKVALIGLTPPDTLWTSSPGPKVDFFPIAATLPGCIADAKAQGATMLVLLSHVGYDVDKALAGSAAYADIDLVVGGHSHTWLWGAPAPAGQPQLPGSPNPYLTSTSLEGSIAKGPYPTNILNPATKRAVPVVTALWGSRYVGQLATTWDAAGNLLSATGRPVLLGDSTSANPVGGDAPTAALVAAYRGPVAALPSRVVGSLAADTTGGGDWALGRNGESSVGNLVCEALVWGTQTIAPAAAVLAANPTLPVVCLENAGGIRADLKAGNVTMTDVTAVLPFGNTLVLLRVTPAALLAALNNGVSQWTGDSTAAGRFPQVSGMRFAFNPTFDASQRLVGAALANGTKLSALTTDLIVITNNFVAGGRDGYTSLAPSTKLLDTSVPDAQVLADYIGAHSPYTPFTDGRIANCLTTTGGLCPPKPKPRPPPPKPKSRPPPPKRTI